MADRELLVRIIGDDRDLQRALGNTDKRLAAIDQRTQRFGRNISRGFAAAGITLGAGAVFAALGRSVDAASALNEEVSKSRQIFGDSSSAIESWAKTTAGSIGVAEVEALRATGTFGNLFATVGLGQQSAAEMSQSLVQLAADLASFNNADPSDVLQAIRSGLIGEAEPLRRFGVLLSETRVQQVAMTESGKDSVKELTNQEKALARYNIILQDTSLAQGDFARTSDGLANQSRILRAQLSDLSAEMGTKLLPIMVQLVGGANDLIDAFTQAGDTLNTDVLGETIQDVDVSAIVDMRDRLAEVKGEGDAVVGVLDDIIDRLRDVQGIVVGGPDSIGGLRGPGAIAASNARVDAENELDRAKAASRELEKVRKAFRELELGLGLKADKAELTQGLDDDLTVLRELEQAILRQIEREGKTFKLVSRLTETRLAISRIVRQQADDARQAGEDAFNATLDALDLRFERAQSTRSLADDETALRAIERALLNRIEAEGETTDLLRQLFQVREQQADVARQLLEQRREQRDRQQFLELGLTAEGEQRTPGAGALRRRASNLEQQIKGTVLDTEKNRQILDRIQRVLSGDFGKVGKNVREAILQMLNDISSAFDEGEKKMGDRGAGEITRGGIRSTQRLLRGLDLTDEQRRILQQRNLGVSGQRGLSAFGFGIGGQTPSTFATGGFGGGLAGAMIINGPITVVTNDPNDLMKKLQKKGRRSSGGRRGRHGGANLGLQ